MSATVLNSESVTGQKKPFKPFAQLSRLSPPRLTSRKIASHIQAFTQ